MKPIVLVDMDDTLVDFSGFAAGLSRDDVWFHQPDGHPEIFAKSVPVPGAVEAIRELQADFELHVVTAAPWLNEHAPSQKLAWIKHYFGKSEDSPFYKRVTISHQKHLVQADYLIDDRPPKFGEFTGTWIHFKNICELDHPHFTEWTEVVAYLQSQK